MKRARASWILLLTVACTGLERKPHAPSVLFAGRKCCVLMLQPPEGVPFRLDQLNRLVWQWSEASPWFREQLVGISGITPSTSSLPSLLESLEEGLKSRSELLLILQPRKFFTVENGRGQRPSGSPDGPILDEAEFLVSLAEIATSREIGAFQVKVSKRSRGDDPILDKLAYEIATKAGFGWRITN